jgi:hypothetical protein
MSAETEINTEPTDWSITLTSTMASVEADNKAAIASIDSVAGILLGNEVEDNEDWLPIAVRYMSSDRKVHLVEREPRAISIGAEKMFLPWTYFLFHDDNKILVMFRPSVITNKQASFHNFFLAETLVEIKGEDGKFSKFNNTKDYVDGYITSIYDKWSSAANNAFDIKLIDAWIKNMVEKIGSPAFPDTIVDQINAGTHDRVALMRELFGNHTFDLVMPVACDKTEQLFETQDDLLSGPKLEHLIKKYSNKTTVSNKSIYTLFLEAVQKAQK